MQDRAKRDLRQQLAQAQLQVMDLQHEVHYLNNQLNPILDGEEDGPNMEEDDDEDEEEVEPEEGDDPISDLDSDHNEDQIAQWLVEMLDVSSLFM